MSIHEGIYALQPRLGVVRIYGYVYLLDLLVLQKPKIRVFSLPELRFP